MCKIISDIVYTFSFLLYYEVFEGASVRKKRFWGWHNKLFFLVVSDDVCKEEAGS